MTGKFVRFEGVRKSFGATDVVRTVSLDIGRGEFFSLLGPSGCGKTTLLRILGGFEAPTSGRVFIDGQDVTGLRAAHRPTNMVFQSYAIFPHLNVAQNIGFGLQNEPISAQERSRRVADAVEMVKLAGLEERRPEQLSGGQRQRMALARAIVKRPKVLLLDEPLSALDKNLREQMQAELRGIQRELGTTFIFVTHDQQEALYLSDRIAVMHGGHIVQVASPHDIYHRPQNRFVAEFVGTMNFLEGKVVEAGAPAYSVDVPGLGPVNCQGEARHRSGETVIVGIRPEVLKLSPAPEPGLVSATLRDTSQLGEKLLCGVDIGGKTVSVAVFSRSLSAQLSALPPGSPIWLSADGPNVCFPAG